MDRANNRLRKLLRPQDNTGSSNRSRSPSIGSRLFGSSTRPRSPSTFGGHSQEQAEFSTSPNDTFGFRQGSDAVDPVLDPAPPYTVLEQSPITINVEKGKRTATLETERNTIPSGPEKPIGKSEGDNCKTTLAPMITTTPPTSSMSPIPPTLKGCRTSLNTPQKELVTESNTEQNPDPEAQLANYDTVFLIDDSWSMNDDLSSSIHRSRWKEAGRVLQQLACKCAEYDEDGIDVHFLNRKNTGMIKRTAMGSNPSAGLIGLPFDGVESNGGPSPKGGFLNLTTPSEVRQLFKEAKPRYSTPTGARLNDILSAYLTYFKLHEENVKPLNLIVITDGAPDNEDDVKNVIKAAIRTLDDQNAKPRQIGIQFFQVGDEEAAAKFLHELDDKIHEQIGSERDMVDTMAFDDRSKHTGELSAEEVLKAVLGAINKDFDRIETKAQTERRKRNQERLEQKYLGQEH